MDKPQAEQIARAIMQPAIQAQAEKRRNTTEKAAATATRRAYSRSLLAGYASGAAIAWFCGQPMAAGALAGAVAGWAIHWFAARRTGAN